ncbi:hypothetical protein JL722_11982 [Aureococcus anophagefferens]|nr:hypothetical protein JL722_11982 [Aureococcus anophagefferens]
MAALWVARLLPLVAASRPSGGGVAAPPAEADSPAWRRLVEAWSRRRLDAGDDACEHAECWSCPTASSCEAAGDGCAWVGGDYPYCDTNHACEAATCFACGLDECAGVDGCMLDAPRGGPGAADYFRPSCTAFRECSGDYDCWACAEAECGAADGCEWLGDYCAEACGAGKCHVCGEDECEARGCDLVDASDLFAGADDDFNPSSASKAARRRTATFASRATATPRTAACATRACACRASETCELYEGDPALLGASACARPDACVPYYACANCDEDLCAVGYVPGCKLSADAKTCEADDAALACSNVNCGARRAGACDALLLCSTTPFGTCAQDLSFLEDGMGPCRAELCELCPAPGCAFGDACAKDEAYYGCGAQACGPASCALCATASACDAVPGCASQSRAGRGRPLRRRPRGRVPRARVLARRVLRVRRRSLRGHARLRLRRPDGRLRLRLRRRRRRRRRGGRAALLLARARGAWQDRALAVFDGRGARRRRRKRTSAHVRDDLCLGDGCYRVGVSGGRPGVFAPCFWTLGPAFAGAAPADADAFWRTTVSCEEPRSFVALEAGTRRSRRRARLPGGRARRARADGARRARREARRRRLRRRLGAHGDGTCGATAGARPTRSAANGRGRVRGLESGASAVDFHCLELDVCYSLTVSGDGPSPEEVHWQLGRVEGRAGFRDTFSLPASPAWSGDVALGCEAPFAAASPAPSAALPEPSARFERVRDALAGSSETTALLDGDVDAPEALEVAPLNAGYPGAMLPRALFGGGGEAALANAALGLELDAGAPRYELRAVGPPHRLLFLTPMAALTVLRATLAGGDVGDDEGGGCVYVSAAATFVVVDGVLRDCHAGFGGAVFAEPFGLVALSRGSSIADSTAAQSGGGVASGDSVVLDASSISNCHARGRAGHKRAEDASTLVPVALFSSTIADCSATFVGGAINVQAGTVHADAGSSILRCGAMVGGGIFTPHAAWLSGGSSIADCGAGDRGGGVFLAAGDVLVIDDGAVRNCDALDGGGVAGERAWVVVAAGGAIEDNVASRSGGGVHVAETSTTASAFDATSEGWRGARLRLAFPMDDADDLVLDVPSGSHANSRTFRLREDGAPGLPLFEANAAVDGGALHLADASSAFLDGVKFADNRAGGAGGAVHAGRLAAFVANNSLLQGNAAAEGGALYGGAMSSLSLTTSLASGNAAAVAGGAVAARGDRVAVADAILKSNTVDGDVATPLAAGGGAVALFDVADATLHGATLRGNAATRPGALGGAVLLWRSTLGVGRATTFEANVAHGGGGALAALGGSAPAAVSGDCRDVAVFVDWRRTTETCLPTAFLGIAGVTCDAWAVEGTKACEGGDKVFDCAGCACSFGLDDEESKARYFTITRDGEELGRGGPAAAALRRFDFCLPPGKVQVRAFDDFGQSWFGGSFSVRVRGGDMVAGPPVAEFASAPLTIAVGLDRATQFVANEATAGGGGALFADAASTVVATDGSTVVVAGGANLTGFSGGKATCRHGVATFADLVVVGRPGAAFELAFAAAGVGAGAVVLVEVDACGVGDQLVGDRCEPCAASDEFNVFDFGARPGERERGRGVRGCPRDADCDFGGGGNGTAPPGADLRPRRGYWRSTPFSSNVAKCKFEAYAALMVAVYPVGVPLLCFVLLWRKRDDVDPPGGAASLARRALAADGGDDDDDRRTAREYLELRRYAEASSRGAARRGVGVAVEILGTDYTVMGVEIADTEKPVEPDLTYDDDEPTADSTARRRAARSRPRLVDDRGFEGGEFPLAAATEVEETKYC